MNGAHLLYAVGVVCAVLALLLSPLPWTCPLPAAAGLIWAAYDLYDDGEDTDGNSAPTPPHH